MYKHLNIFFFALLLCLSQLYGQGYYKSFLDESGVFYDAVAAGNGGLFVVGGVESYNESLFTLIDAQGQTQFHKKNNLNGATALATCRSGNNAFWVLLQNYADTDGKKNVLAKVDLNGDILFTKVIGNQPFLANGLKDIVETGNEGVLLVGETRDETWTRKTWWVLIDGNGNLLEDKKLDLNERVHKVLALPNGNFMLLGESLLIHADQSGAVLWTRSLSGATAKDFAYLNSGHVLILGVSNLPTFGELKIKLFKYDLDGQQSWNRELSTPVDLGISLSLSLNADGNIFVPCLPSSESTVTTFNLLELNEDGFLLNNTSLSPKVRVHKILTKGQKLCMVGTQDGPQLFPAILVTDYQGNFESSIIEGQVYHDLNGNCARDTGEPGFKDAIVKAFNAFGESYYKLTDANGNYQIRVSPGDFWVNATPVYGPASFYALCNQQQVNVPGVGQSIPAMPTGIQTLEECPLLDVEISGGLLRRCTTSTYSIHYCNAGNQPATGVQLKLNYDPNLQYNSSIIAPLNPAANPLVFQLDNLNPGDCEVLYVKFNVSCSPSLELGDVLCVEAEMEQAEDCLLPNPGGDGSKLKASGTCLGNVARFRIQNVGTAGTTETLKYVILEDHIMLSPVSFGLGAGEEIVVDHPLSQEDSCVALRIFSNGAAELAKPVAVVENCNNPNGNMNLLLDLPSVQSNPSIASHCDEIIGAYDPNDKRGFPRGLGERHYIKRGDDLEYMIRFQNTGNDTAFLVIIEDQLPETLDPSTLRPIGASHPYEWSLSEQGLLKFRFPNINLPDSNINEAASHGYVMFRVSQRPFLADQTKILNSAAIYFDLNAPVITNISLHTIDASVISSTSAADNASSGLTLIPNPADDEVLLNLSAPPDLSEGLQVRICDALGRLCLEASFNGTMPGISTQNLHEGLYFVQVFAGNKMLAIAPLNIQH